MALERVEGVDSAIVSYEAGSGWVAFDPALTSPEAFIGEMERMTGFTAEIMATGRDAADRRIADAADVEHADMDMSGGDDHDDDDDDDDDHTEAEHDAAADTTSR